MKQIDEERLEEDAQHRYEFLADFIGFGPDDVKLIQASAPHLGPRIGEMVDSTYKKLLSCDATARHFVPKQHGCETEAPQDLSQVTDDHPQIQFRKDHLNRYFVSLIGRSYDAKMVQYLDMVGKIHTTQAGNSAIHVPLVQMNALLGLISDILTETLIASPLDDKTTLRSVQSFQKLMWIQNDFVSRHYR
ncbi:MAG: hypothetical protein GY903_15275 [Fuerstiella sp.]|nr:hypothetical protein [Fuerstiella sp.]MCP4855842.1 hypothetical protein [Fuerstiella sp.]